MASLCSLVDVVRSLGTADWDRAALGPAQTELWAQGMARGMAARAAIGDDAFIDVWMDDLVRQPMATMNGIYEQLGWPFTNHAEDAMRVWLGDNPQHGRGGHEPDAARYGLAEPAVNERFADYRGRFGREGN